MKYIRTVNGVYDIDNASKYLTRCSTEQEFENLSKKNCNCFYINTDRKVVCSKQHGQLIVTPYIKSADTIEKLCDHLVIIERDSPNLPWLTHRCFGVFTLTECERKGFQENELEIYGSIWVDGNLIKVAKMNKEEELELL